jgi:hypothetical protein
MFSCLHLHTFFEGYDKRKGVKTIKKGKSRSSSAGRAADL